MTTRCPKCGYDNPEGTLFCEECDWRMDQIYKGERNRNPLMFSAIVLVIGIIAIAMHFAGMSSVAMVAGIVGMVGGGYSVNLPRYIECNKSLCMALAGIGLMLSIVGFIFGLAGVI